MGFNVTLHCMSTYRKGCTIMNNEVVKENCLFCSVANDIDCNARLVNL